MKMYNQKEWEIEVNKLNDELECKYANY